ncbi:MAG: helix-turn-helix transcriptional regulator [Rhodoglobus sp.]|nr:helix-turn-helix transcriptional regulator [Rhodoglobus sp.]
MTSSIREARLRRGIGTRELARLMEVSPSAVTQWERSEQRGTAQLGTVRRAIDAIERTPSAFDRTLERREDRVTLELHRELVKKIIDDPDPIFALVPRNLERTRAKVTGSVAEGWLDEWERLVSSGSLGQLVDRALGTDDRSISMRQVSPFLGALTEDERRTAIERAS